MTTRIHVVNFGPNPVEVHTPNSTPEKLYQQQSSDHYVHDQHDVVVKEIKEDRII